jgi:hypothetical protein
MAGHLNFSALSIKDDDIIPYTNGNTTDYASLVINGNQYNASNLTLAGDLILVPGTTNGITFTNNGTPYTITETSLYTLYNISATPQNIAYTNQNNTFTANNVFGGNEFIVGTIGGGFEIPLPTASTGNNSGLQIGWDFSSAGEVDYLSMAQGSVGGHYFYTSNNNTTLKPNSTIQVGAPTLIAKIDNAGNFTANGLIITGSSTQSLTTYTGLQESIITQNINGYNFSSPAPTNLHETDYINLSGTDPGGHYFYNVKNSSGSIVKTLLAFIDGSGNFTTHNNITISGNTLTIGTISLTSTILSYLNTLYNNTATLNGNNTFTGSNIFESEFIVGNITTNGGNPINIFNTISNNTGLQIGWDNTNGIGEVDYLCMAKDGTGGHYFYTGSNSFSPRLNATIDGNGNFSTISNSTALANGDATGNITAMGNIILTNTTTTTSSVLTKFMLSNLTGLDPNSVPSVLPITTTGTDTGLSIYFNGANSNNPLYEVDYLCMTGTNTTAGGHYFYTSNNTTAPVLNATIDYLGNFTTIINSGATSGTAGNITAQGNLISNGGTFTLGTTIITASTLQNLNNNVGLLNGNNTWTNTNTFSGSSSTYSIFKNNIIIANQNPFPNGPQQNKALMFFQNQYNGSNQETDYLNFSNGGNGGHYFYNINANISTPVLLTSIDGNGNLRTFINPNATSGTTSGNITAQGNLISNGGTFTLGSTTITAPTLQNLNGNVGLLNATNTWQHSNLFKYGITITGGPLFPTTSQTSQGLTFFQNQYNGINQETDYLNYSNGGNGGHYFYNINANTSTPKLLTSIDGNGNLTNYGNSLIKGTGTFNNGIIISNTSGNIPIIIASTPTSLFINQNNQVLNECDYTNYSDNTPGGHYFFTSKLNDPPILNASIDGNGNLTTFINPNATSGTTGNITAQGGLIVGYNTTLPLPTSIPGTFGLQIGWNNTNGTGEVDYLCMAGPVAGGGHYFYNGKTNETPNLITKIDGVGDLTTMGGITTGMSAQTPVSPTAGQIGEIITFSGPSTTQNLSPPNATSICINLITSTSITPGIWLINAYCPFNTFLIFLTLIISNTNASITPINNSSFSFKQLLYNNAVAYQDNIMCNATINISTTKNIYLNLNYQANGNGVSLVINANSVNITFTRIA